MSWSTAGSKNVRATNSNCGVAAGNRGVTITDGSTGGGGLNPQFTYSPAAPAPGVPVNFDSATSTGTISTRVWDFGDGISGTGAQASHTYAAAGTYNVTLTVTDDEGATNQRSAPVSVTAPPPPPPSSITLTISGRTDAEKHYITHLWSGAAGSSVPSPSVSNRSVKRSAES